MIKTTASTIENVMKIRLKLKLKRSSTMALTKLDKNHFKLRKKLNMAAEKQQLQKHKREKVVHQLKFNVHKL